MKKALKKSKSNGVDSAVGKYILAIHYYNGWGINQNYSHSLQLYKEAAEDGHAGACHKLARLYLQGHSMASVKKILIKQKNT